jgi:predicted enzyme related to lactoylglutathione lyase
MNLVAHVEIPVLDLERAMRFYATLFHIDFGEPVEIHGNRMAFFPFEEGRDGASGALCQGEIYVPTHDGAVVYLSVDDIDAALATAQSLGSEILFPKTELDSGAFVAEIEDSEGNRLALQTT